MTTPREPTPAELLAVPDAETGIINLGVVAHWLAATHDAVMPDCREPMPRPGRTVALGAPWRIIPGGRG